MPEEIPINVKLRMNPRQHLALIGSGASAIYLLKHLLDRAGTISRVLGEISVFEKSELVGMGMPYNPLTTDRCNMSNISSEELPELAVPFADWLRAQPNEILSGLGIRRGEIDESTIYSRLALGSYLHAQYRSIIASFGAAGIAIHEWSGCEVADVIDRPEESRVTLVTVGGESHTFDKVIIATGHVWSEDDRPDAGYYASPWPIFKLLPDEGEVFNFPIGTLGASLSAFDVLSSLAHRHGQFVANPEPLTYLPHAGTDDFKIFMHSAQGMLPHLQFAQVEPLRSIYRHVAREGMLELIDNDGFIRLEAYFDRVCRPALRLAFQKDGMDGIDALLATPTFGMLDFVAKMSGLHEFGNAFEGMRLEMKAALESVELDRPIHWKEVLDDLMYTLNFHAGLLPAEDHLTLHSDVFPFLMNVIAALPLTSAASILALYDAGKLGLVTGRVSIPTDPSGEHGTTVSVDDDGAETTIHYKKFVDCSGQKALDLEDYPFPSLVADGTVRRARARFADAGAAQVLSKEERERLTGGEFLIGGIDIDSGYRVIGTDGLPNPRIYDIAFPHISGIRPYSYGLQSCADTSAILAESWADEINSAFSASYDVCEITEIYERIQAGDEVNPNP